MNSLEKNWNLAHLVASSCTSSQCKMLWGMLTSALFSTFHKVESKCQTILTLFYKVQNSISSNFKHYYLAIYAIKWSKNSFYEYYYKFVQLKA